VFAPPRESQTTCHLTRMTLIGIYLFSCLLTYSLTYSLIYLLTYLLTCLLTNLLTCLLTYSLTHSLPHLTYSLTYSLTHSHTYSLHLLSDDNEEKTRSRRGTYLFTGKLNLIGDEDDPHVLREEIISLREKISHKQRELYVYMNVLCMYECKYVCMYWRNVSIYVCYVCM